MAGLAACSFSLNGRPMSALVCNGSVYPAFSGMPNDRNNPAKAADAGSGPIPPGVYYIVDHPKGGRMQWLNDEIRDAISHSDRANWFGLYSTTTAADFMFVNGVRRGTFRLHPIGALRISEGCITLLSQASFDQLSTFLRRQAPANIPGTKIRYFGTVTVT